MAKVKVYHNNAWEISGGGQEFTQTEKTKLSNIGEVKTATTTSDVSITNGNGWTTIKTISGLDSSGKYIVISYASYQSNIANAHTPWLRMANYAQSFYSPYNTTLPLFIVRYVTGSTSVKLEISPQTSAVTGGKIASGAYIWAIRVG